jgi:diguanylate cyclase (GGDEF)-like protein/PAS domain S-box-containing protein
MDRIESPPPREPAAMGLLTQAITQMANAVAITGVDGRIAWVNDAFCQMSGYARNDLIGATPSILKSGKQSAEFYAALWQQVLSGKVWEGKIVDARKDQSLYIADQTITPLRDADGIIRHFVAVQHDVTQHERRRERDRFLALHDALTGLPNRAFLRESIRKTISSASRNEQLLAVMFIDLDGFKAVNDGYGHLVGDQLLAAVAERLRKALRQADTVARVGGDEFVALAVGLDHRAGAAGLAKKLVDALTSPFVVRGNQLSVGASVGIAMFPADGSDGDALVNNADLAMYRAKLEGGKRYHFFEQDGEPAARASDAGTADHAP